jgi:ATP-binding cassette subfamily B protein
MIMASFAEIISIGAVLPFLAVLTAPERLFNNPSFHIFVRVLNITEPSQLLFPLTSVFAITVLLSASLRLLTLWASTRLSFSMGADLSTGMYYRTLYQPYVVHVSRNSSEIITGITSKAHIVINCALMPLLILISSSAMLLVILIALIVIEPVVALSIFGGVGTIYVSIVGLSSRKLAADSRCIAKESTQVIKSLQEGLGGIRDVLINGDQAAYCQLYRSADIPLRRAQGNNVFISASPRYFVEALGIILIAVLAYVLARQPDGIVTTIPVLGALALGAQRMLPVMQQAYSSWSNIQGELDSLKDVLDMLEQPLPDYVDRQPVEPMPFRESINLRGLSFRYGQGPFVLKDLNLSISRGSHIGFIGATGSGKSTLLDIIMGLLQPTEGELSVDGQLLDSSSIRAWHAHIAHVPQMIFLADSTIAENIAFGVPKDDIDPERVRQAAIQAQIADVIESWPKKYQTFAGERGIKLSGGQRQRIGIARALYKQADVIIFDEATSALDSETEEAVMRAIESLSKELTILIIAHRLTTLKHCTSIIELCEGSISRVGSYNDIVRQGGSKLMDVLSDDGQGAERNEYSLLGIEK